MGKLKFESPCVINCVELDLEQGILSSSVVDSVQIETTGQEVIEYGMNPSDQTFNHEWY